MIQMGSTKQDMTGAQGKYFHREEVEAKKRNYLFGNSLSGYLIQESLGGCL